MKKVFHSAESRGAANHGWLQAKHSFSFASWYNPERIQFGALRVLNDDTIAPGMGFGTHPHDNMEIITIPLQGALEHKDSMENTGVIEADEIQVMSAGTGIYHSEYNKNKDQPVSLLQIWIFPKTQNVTPRYDQKNIKDLKKANTLYAVVGPDSEEAALWIHQDAWFHLGEFDRALKTDYTVKKKGNGVYVFLIEGAAEVAGHKLEKRDAIGIWETDQFVLNVTPDTRVLTIEVPLNE